MLKYCYYHDDKIINIICKRCNKNLCNECHEKELNLYCFVCYLEVKNEEYIEEKNPSFKLSRFSRHSLILLGIIFLFLAFFLIVPAIALSGLSAGSSADSEFLLILISLLIFIMSLCCFFVGASGKQKK